ncbi:hypothetical protein PRK78_005575 [Emydomyces testavorans]|uniref:Tail specific protease domain-containing protein n=1 Tax=Emydomyces testavorans TaxID=2070801 RepID=A0AAF0DJU8_9EURO|nr:hypothetical protein PRK78_005575 [Emydomyces testavorans]
MKNDNIRLMRALEAYFQWHSTTDYLKNPPKTYTLPGIDLEERMRDIISKLESNSYKNQYEFEAELSSMTTQAHDGHLGATLRSWAVFRWYREEIGPLASISLNGKDLPQIFAMSKYVPFFSTAQRSLNGGLGDLNSTNSGFQPSPIVTIDGEDSVKWLEAMSLNSELQDRDAMYNNQFYAPSLDTSSGNFARPFEHPGAITTIGFKNGTERQYKNAAFLRDSFEGITDGVSFYKTFAELPPKDFRQQPSEVVRRGITRPSTAVMDPKSIEDYRSKSPKPISNCTLEICGYFLDKHPDTAVLAIARFMNGDELLTFMSAFSDFVTKFLAACKTAGKKKLIIDVTGNGGGLLLLAYDLLKQIFPTVDLTDLSEVRAIDQLDLTGSKVMSLLTSNKTSSEVRKNATETMFNLDLYWGEDGKKFSNWTNYFGPEVHSGFNFTKASYYDLNSTAIIGLHSGFSVAGYGNRPHPPPAVFAVDNVVLLSNGVCISACGSLATQITKHGVRTITVGGRPREGTIQAIGGVLGSQAITFEDINTWVKLIYETSTPEEQQRYSKTLLGRIHDDQAFLRYRLEAGVINYRNAIDYDDPSRIPRQFKYYPSTFRLWMTKEMLFDTSAIWNGVAEHVWG